LVGQYLVTPNKEENYETFSRSDSKQTSSLMQATLESKDSRINDFEKEMHLLSMLSTESDKFIFMRALSVTTIDNLKKNVR
jgi:hypothetical protein